MAADLHIHILEGVTEQDLAILKSHSLGSKYFRPGFYTNDQWEEAYDKISKTPNVWVGEVSWLKAALYNASETFVPTTVEKIVELVGENLPVLDDKLIADIVGAFGEKNTTGYMLNNAREVKAFLKSHKGKRVFTVSW